MFLWYVIKFTHMTFGLVPKVLYPIDMVLTIFSVYKLRAMVDSIVFKIGHVQNIIAGKIVCVDQAVRLNFRRDYRH
ncbi:hypothetical protein O185_06760 [Photorhabdus temperata J3]|uniref:Uncharacterized protein n=1 Tax=Photorhabdus temperata J3 TaxID=1389415 RepID=U7R2H1_PHOTE|nr:hypothetical protein O185_06760 [Photorhabdus temperata J3]